MNLDRTFDSLHPGEDYPPEAIRYHRHLAESMVQAGAPVSVVIGFLGVDPEPPNTLEFETAEALGGYQDVCIHGLSLAIYGWYEGRCAACQSTYRLWLPQGGGGHE